MKYGPTRGEWWLRLAISLGGLALLAGAIAVRGWPEGPGLVEVAGFGGVFLGWSAFSAARALWRG